MPERLDAALVDDAFVLRHFIVDTPSMVYVRGIFEASDGIGIPFSMGGGEIVVATFSDRAPELDALLNDLQQELGAEWLSGPKDVTAAWRAHSCAIKAKQESSAL